MAHTLPAPLEKATHLPELTLETRLGISYTPSLSCPLSPPRPFCRAPQPVTPRSHLPVAGRPLGTWGWKQEHTLWNDSPTPGGELTSASWHAAAEASVINTSELSSPLWKPRPRLQPRGAARWCLARTLRLEGKQSHALAQHPAGPRPGETQLLPFLQESADCMFLGVLGLFFCVSQGRAGAGGCCWSLFLLAGLL